MKIVAVDHVQITIPKGAEPKARAFYCDVLKCKEIAKPEALAARGGFWLELAGFAIHVGAEDGFDRHLTKAHVAYRVEALEDWRKMLVSRGVEIIDGIQFPQFQRFEFRDPFGNRVEFLERSSE